MDRRRFMGGVLGAGAAMSTSIAFDAREAGAASLLRPPPQGISYRFLTNDPQYRDARPVFSPRGDQVLFMRSPVDHLERSSFWIVPTSGGKASKFYENPDLQATRPDWSRSRRSACRFYAVFCSSRRATRDMEYAHSQ